MAAPMIEKVRAAWRDAGRDGEPRLSALTYFGLGDDDASRQTLRRYYSFLGDYVDAVVESAVRTSQAAQDTVRAFADIGITEFVFMPSVPDLAEVDRLADAVL
jgi:hypothetical protein